MFLTPQSIILTPGLEIVITRLILTLGLQNDRVAMKIKTGFRGFETERNPGFRKCTDI